MRPHPNPLPQAGEGACSLAPVLGGEGWGEGVTRRAHAAFPISPRGLNASATTMITNVKTTL